MRLWQPLTELRERLRQYPAWVLVLAAPLYVVVFFGCLISLPLLLLRWVLSPLLGPPVAPIVRSRAVRWMSTKRVEDFPVYLAELAGLFRWEMTGAADLLQRIRASRRILLVLIGGQRAALLATGFIIGASLVWSIPDVAGPVLMACAAGLVAAAILSLFGLGYYHRLYESWQTLDTALCGQCGYIREHLESPRCPECGTAEPPVWPGYAPPCRYVWSPLINKGTAGMPLSLFCSTFFFDRVVLHPCFDRVSQGWAILVITVSAAGMVLWVLRVFRYRWKEMYVDG